MLGYGGFFFLNIIVDQAWHAAAVKTAGRFMLGLTFGVAHEAFVERLFGADKVIIVKGQFAAFAAL